MTNQLPTVGSFSPEDIQVMKDTLAKDATPAQFNLFVRTAAASGLNPFLNHIYCIVYNGKMSIQISVEGIVYLAKKVEGYQGIDTQLVHENDEFEASIDKEGKWSIDRHVIKFPRGKVIAAYSIAYREGFRPYTVFMDVEEVEHHKAGTNAANWKKYFNDFFKKTVTKRAAKGQFGIDISEDEMPGTGASDSIPEYQQQRKDITQAVDSAAAEHNQAPPEGTTTESETDSVKEVNRKTRAALAELGYFTDDEIGEHMAKHMQMKGEKPTLAERKTYLKTVEMQVAEMKASQPSDDVLPE